MKKENELIKTGIINDKNTALIYYSYEQEIPSLTVFYSKGIMDNVVKELKKENNLRHIILKKLTPLLERLDLPTDKYLTLMKNILSEAKR